MSPGLDAFFDKAAQAAQAIDAGGAGEATGNLAFEDTETLLTVLTAGRWQLLRFLRRHGATSIRRLSQLLQRDYRAVHRDVHALMAAGLIARNAEGAISVPWERIAAKMAMDLAAGDAALAAGGGRRWNPDDPRCRRRRHTAVEPGPCPC